LLAIDVRGLSYGVAKGMDTKEEMNFKC
jgi:hypothetical protein